MIRVGVLLEQCLAPVPGGTGRYSAQLAQALAASAPADATLTGLSAWHLDLARARVPGLGPPRRLPLPRRLLAEAWARGRGPGPGGFDVVHAPTLLAPPRRASALVVTIHDTVPWTHPQTLSPRGAAWHRRIAARVAREADLVVVPTEAVRLDLARFLTPARVEVVGEGVSRALAEPPDAAERAARLGLPARYFATLATLEPRKGLDVAIAALSRPEAPRLPLVVVGQPGWGGVDPRQLARRHGLAAERIVVLGRLPDSDLAVVLRRATAVLVPSRAEGFGLPALEAMWLGTPVVVSDVAALVEVTAGAALVVAQDDPAALAAAAARIAEDAGLRQGMVAAGRARAGHYSWEAAARRMWQLYRELAPVAPGSAPRA
ncbi:MAG: glycosyltransferase family 4 protein [Mycobacteriales bacterium]